jgi:AraC-like DNA-binding protein
MLLLAVVPGVRLHQLRTADPKLYSFIGLPSWAEVVDTIRHRPVEMAVLDPAFDGHMRTREIERLRVLFPSLPVLIYTSLTPEAPGVLLELGRIGIRRVILARFDDSPASLRTILRDELESTASRKVIQGIDRLLVGLPMPARWAVEAMLHAPTEIATVSALAERVRVQRRTCERWFAKVGLPSPRTVLVLARLLYAHRLLQDPGYTVEDVALKLGYGRTRSLQDQFKEVFGLTAGEVRLSLTVEEALDQVTKRYFGGLRKVAS